MKSLERYAPGWPGIPARWTSSAKSGVGTALGSQSRVWFTLSHGIFNEIYYPRIDQACVRDCGMIVTAGTDFLSEEKRDADSTVTWLAPGVPAFAVVNRCRQGRYRIEKEILADPHRDAILQRTRFIAEQGKIEDYRLHLVLAPHLGNQGGGNNAWLGDYKGLPMLFADQDGIALALACSVPWLQRSVGFVGVSDGWQDLLAHNRMTWDYTRAKNGNVALAAELDLAVGSGECLIVLGFGSNCAEAGNRARAALQSGFAAAQADYGKGWQNWQKELLPLDPEGGEQNLYRVSTAVVALHESGNFPGGLIASLSIPWGFSKGDNDLGGYHLAWPRDLVESAGGLLAAGAAAEVRRVLAFLQATQEADGHWAQNMWLDGSPYWNGIQMDETALPVLLVDLARREEALSAEAVARFWPMVRAAVAYLIRCGPVSMQDRWEEDPGYSPFTIAAEIAALLAAAELAELQQEAAIAGYLRETADVWYAAIDHWMYVTDTDWCRQFEVAGYYVRIAPVESEDGVSRFQQSIPVKNVAPDQAESPACHLISPDALALVRFGLRRADDPRILDTVKVVDALLRTETKQGPVWHRYNGDGYGEHADGAPFDGTGIGRAWPLLTGERAHFELAAGRESEARRLQVALESFAGAEGLLPEQVWDAPDLAERELWFGRPSGSAMPLVWAHAEYLKLLRSLHDGAVFDLPPQTVQRYLVDKTTAGHAVWRFNHKLRTLPVGRTLRIETLAAAVVHWSQDAWATTADARTRDGGLGIHLADLPTAALPAGTAILFTLYWPDTGNWEGTDFMIRIEARPDGG
ncbi:glucan 1,4-alpha-glucosidase [Desulfuromonas carbonis]|uniref:glucan 1,4-alpha-glucosidase n=1 Tax=Desulfuromonas sp. DDH964 TaxID=1823759 RepID=UPI00078D2229|nr:glucan 1,4-alpha-glucosidase [Desulfuromonas sp. DDH964]AMV71208.1 Glucoamylase precursor [Desulfuromonas sp. DDH964]